MAPPVQSSMFQQPSTPIPGQNGNSSNGLPTTSFSYSLNPSSNESDPPAIREWREKQADNIATRDATAERKKGEAISKAEEDIDRFYREYNEGKEKNIRKNKLVEFPLFFSHHSFLFPHPSFSLSLPLTLLLSSLSSSSSFTSSSQL